MSSSLLGLAVVGLLALFWQYDGLWQYLKELSSSAWNRQVDYVQSTLPNLQTLFFNIWAAVILVILALEHIRPWRKHQKRFRKGFGLDFIYITFAFAFFNLLGGSAAYVLIVTPFNDFLGNVLNAEYPLISFDDIPIWMRIVLLVLASDFISYWGHRLLHRVNFLWQIHKIHHSSMQLDVMNAVRMHWLETLWYNVFRYATLGMLGFNAPEILAINLATFFLCYFTHANVFIPIGKLKYIINSPQMHLWHHAVDINPNRNVNYGSALSVWDWIFGTAYYPGKPPEDLRLGFEDVEEFPTTFLGQFIYPFSVFGSKVKQIFITTPPVSTDE